MNMIASLPHNKQQGLRRKGIESGEGSVRLQVTPAPGKVRGWGRGVQK